VDRYALHAPSNYKNLIHAQQRGTLISSIQNPASTPIEEHATISLKIKAEANIVDQKSQSFEVNFHNLALKQQTID
jgi:hypothetical protein